MKNMFLALRLMQNIFMQNDKASDNHFQTITFDKTMNDQLTESPDDTDCMWIIFEMKSYFTGASASVYRYRLSQEGSRPRFQMF